MENMKPKMEVAVLKTVEEAVKCFHDDKYDDAINFLRNNRKEIGEFCLQIRDSYGENDKSTPFLRIAMLIEKLL